MITILPVAGTIITLEPDQIESGDLVTISIYDLPDGSVFSLDMQANLQVTPGSDFSFETANFVMPFTLEDGELAATMQNTQQNVLNAKKNDTEVKKIGNSVDGYYSTSESGTISAGTYDFIKLGGTATPDATEVVACLSLSGTKRGPDNSQISFYAIGTSAGSVDIIARVNGAEALNQVIIMGTPPATTSSTTSPTPTYTYSGGGGGGGYTSGNTYITTTISPTETTPSPETTKTEVPAQETAKSVTAEATTNPATEPAAGTPPPTSAAAHCLVAVLAIVLGIICVSMRKR